MRSPYTPYSIYLGGTISLNPEYYHSFRCPVDFSIYPCKTLCIADCSVLILAGMTPLLFLTPAKVEIAKDDVEVCKWQNQVLKGTYMDVSGLKFRDFKEGLQG